MTGTRDVLLAEAEAALANGDEERIEPRLAAEARRNPRDAVVLHWLALLRRALDRRELALADLAAAQALDPGNATIAHAMAQVSLEAGRPAAALFEAAIRMAPGNADLRLGLAGARLAEGDGARALAELDAMLAANAGWYVGHRQYAQLATQCGRGAEAFGTIERALQRFPDAGQLYLLAADLLVEGERYGEALDWVARGVARLGEADPLMKCRAGALDEVGRGDEAAGLFARLGPADEIGHAIRRQRHLLRRGEAGQAVAELEPWLERSEMQGLWPYAALAWRIAGDPRHGWLESPDMVMQIDLAPGEIDLPALAEFLRGLHGGAGRFIDQSVRQGTQTDGNLLARTEPQVAALRAVLHRAIRDYAAKIETVDPAHPLHGRRPHAQPRFSGSWSVRLTDRGFHEYHHHPQGWVSSAFYVAVPERLSPGEGCLQMGGSPSDLGLGLAPLVEVEPRPGRLAMFPSTMWHGTTPFAAGERMTVAYDVMARPC